MEFTVSSHWFFESLSFDDERVIGTCCIRTTILSTTSSCGSRVLSSEVITIDLLMVPSPRIKLGNSPSMLMRVHKQASQRSCCTPGEKERDSHVGSDMLSIQY